MKLVKGILIDPFACEVTEIERDAHDFRTIYPLLSHETMPVSCFTTIALPGNDAIFVDDEGLLKVCDRWFQWKGYYRPLAGKGLILGSDENGYADATKTVLADARKRVKFLERISGGIWKVTTKPWVPQTVGED
jgi:hypothetical protein